MNSKNRLFALLFSALGSFFALQGAAYADEWYVSKLATGTVHDGKSWATAWLEFSGSTPESRIDWSPMKPGDTINIDGGSSAGATITYTTPIVVQKSDLRIAIPNDPLHNKGQVVLEPPSGTAIDLKTFPVQNVTIQGSHWRAGAGFTMPSGYNSVIVQSLKYGPNLRIQSNFRGTGIAIGPTAKNIVIRNLHLMNNSVGLNLTGGTTYGYYLMLNQNGTNVSSTAAANARDQFAWLYWSWLYNANSNGGGSNVYCKSDVASKFDLKLNYSVIGPGFYNAIQTMSTADSVSSTYSLFLGNSIDLYCYGTPRLADLTYDIIYKPQLDRYNMANSNFSFTKSAGTSVFGTIVYGGSVKVTGSGLLGMANKQFKTSGNTMVLSATQENPLFKTDVAALYKPSFYTYTTLDLTPSNGTPGTPYCIHSVDELYSKVPKL
jgi:hypothetical protein